MHKLAVLGDRDSILGFKALGLETVFADTPEVGAEELHRLAREGYAVVYITEMLAQRIMTDIAKYKDDIAPAVILIPGKGGSMGIGLSALKRSIVRAVGADILGDQ
ncbi:MAG: V-type ATP synthase subunit F [Clostridiales bacterium]|nr:V-type ATP synthase subunit F [Clostridiales bacterium]